MDVELPDGTIVQGVPDGMSKADLAAKLRANGHDMSWLDGPAAQPQLDAAAPLSPARRVGGKGGSVMLPEGLAEDMENIPQLVKRSGARVVDQIAGLPEVAGDVVRNVGEAAFEKSAALLGVDPKQVPVKIAPAQPLVNTLQAVAESAPVAGTRQWAKAKEQEALDSLTPTARRAIELSLVEHDEEEGLMLGEGATDPWWWTANVIDVGAQAATGLGATAVAARMSYAAKYRQVLGELSTQKIPQSLAIKTAEAEALKAAKRSAVIAGGLTEGAQAGSAGASQVRQTIESLNEETLMSYPGYMELRDEGMSHEEARERVAKDKAAAVAIASGTVVGITGAPMNAYFGQLAAKFGRTATSPSVRGRLATAGKGALGEGAQEFVQEGSEQLIQNTAEQPITGVDTWDGVLENAITGFALGGLVGGVVDLAVSGKKGNAPAEAAPDEPPPPPDPMGPVQQAEVNYNRAAAALEQAEAAARDPSVPIKYADVQKAREEHKKALVDFTRELLHSGAIPEKDQPKIAEALKQAEAEGITATSRMPAGGDISPARDAALEAAANAEQLEESDANDLVSNGLAKVNARGIVVLTPEGRRQRKAAQERAKAEEADKTGSKESEPKQAVKPAAPVKTDKKVITRPKMVLPVEKRELREKKARAKFLAKTRVQAKEKAAQEVRDADMLPATVQAKAQEQELTAAELEAQKVPTPNPQMREAFERARRGLPPKKSTKIAAFRLKGAPETVDVPGKGKVKVEPVKAAKDAAAAYRAARGITTPEQTEFARVDPKRAKRIADAFDKMEHAPNDPVVKRAYRAMVDETKAQWQEIKKSGLKVEFIQPGQKDPYAASPRLAIEDVRDNNHLWVYPTDSGFGSDDRFTKDNPMLEDSGENIGGHQLKNNDVFRIVHDYFGHVQEANGFRADGEENAWRIHASMYSPLARRAMTTETRGQNSWVNYGPKGEKNRTASAGETTYADQKIGLLPAEFSAFPGDTLKFKHFSSATDDTLDLDPEKMGTGAKGAEAKRGGPKVVALYSEDGEVEADVTSGRTRYNVEIPKEDLYDASEDLQGLLAQAQVPFGMTTDAQGNIVPVGTRFDMNKFEELVRDAGYLGYHTPSASGILKGQARIFQKYPATRADLAQRQLEGAARMKRATPEAKVRKLLTPEENARLKKASAKKLIEVFDELPDGAELAASAIAGEAKRGWYRRSAEALSNVFGPDAPRFTALLAALSPQTSVEWNFRNAVATWVAWDKAGRPTDRKAIVSIMENSLFPNSNKAGRRNVLPAWINNSVRALSAEDPSTVTLSGPKVDSFAANLRGETERVTLDAWMANWAGVDQALFKGGMTMDPTNPGLRPGYLAFAARVREAAKILSDRTGETWTPAEVQETVWSWAKTLYEQAESYGALATAREILDSKELTDDLINATPDFAGQFEDPEVASILAGTVYGPRAARSAGEAAARRGAGRKTTAPAEGDDRRLRRAADRLDALRQDRRDAESQTREEGAMAVKTDTAAFREWFGNSKVVNADGSPMVVYHGNAHGDGTGISVFDRMASNTRYAKRAVGMDTVGTWFSDTTEGGNLYSGGDRMPGGSITPTYLAIQNPWRPKDFFEFLDKMHITAGRDPAVQNPKGRGSTEELRAWLKAKGYDGIVFPRANLDGVEQQVWVALEPTQIKSSVGNNGAFDGSNPDIAMRRGTSTKGITAADLQEVAARVTAELGVEAKIADSQDTLPDYVQALIPEGAMDVTGMFVEDTVTGETEIWFVRSNINSKAEAYENALHETVGHMGLRAVLGASYHKVMADIRKSFPAQVAAAAKRNLIDVEITKARAANDHAAVRRLESLAAEELVAYAAGRMLQKRGALSKQSVWRRIVAKVRDILRNVGLLNGYSGEDIEALIYRARDYFRKPAQKRAQEIGYRSKLAMAAKAQPKDAPQWLDPEEYLAEDDLNPAPEKEGLGIQVAKGPVNEQIVFPPNFDTVMRGNDPFQGQVDVEAYADGKRIGYVSLSETDANLHTNEAVFGTRGWSAQYVYVDPGYRGKGVAQRMYAAISDKLGAPALPARIRTPAGRRMWDSFKRRKVAFRMKNRPQTQTPAFKEWFGDSKVVGKDGGPLRVFHGTSENFDAFNTTLGQDRKIKNLAWGGDLGSWFTGESKYTGNYDEGNAEFVANEFAGYTYEGADEVWVDGASVIPAYLSIQNPIEFESWEHFGEVRAEANETAGHRLTGREFRAVLKADGHDGMVIRNSMTDGNVDRDDWVAFEPEQIKSAVGNSGAFSKVDQRIAFAFKQGPTGNPDLDSFITKIGAAPLTLRQRWDNWRAGLRERMITALVDPLYGIKAALDSAGMDLDPYMGARLSRHGAELTQSIIENGPPVWNDGATDVGPGLSLLDILRPLGGNVNLWLVYMTARRADRLMTEGRERLFNQTEINAALDLARSHPEFDIARAQYNQLQKQVLDFAEASGVIDPAGRAIWEHGDYIPFHRIVENGQVTIPATGSFGAALGKVRNQIKQLKGGRQHIGDPLENIVRNWSSLMDASLKAQATREIVDALNGTGLVTPKGAIPLPSALPITQAAQFNANNPALVHALQSMGINPAQLTPQAFLGLQRMLAQPKADRESITVWRNGRRESWMVHDPMLLAGLMEVSPDAMSPLIRGLVQLGSYPKRLVTRMITATPQFMVKNFWRDVWHNAVLGAKVSGTRLDVLPHNSLAGLISTLKNDADARSLLAAGGSFTHGYVNAGDISGASTVVRRAIRPSNTAGVVLDSMAKVLRLYTDLQAAAENANRVAVYRKGIDKGLTRRQAAFASRDVLDFSQRGQNGIIRFLTSTVPFFNARLQGLYRVGHGMKSSFASVAIRGLLLSAASLALLLRNYDDERYKALTDQEKSNYWHFFDVLQDGDHFRLPKPFEVGTVFGTIPEAIADTMLTNATQPDALKQSVEYLTYAFEETLNLAPKPQLIWPMVELAVNQNTFTQAPILTQGDEAVLPEDQRGPGTSPTYSALANAMPSFAPDAMRSPKQLEHLGRGYLGNLQDYVLLATDALVREARGEPPAPEKALREIPGIRDFYRTGPARNTRHLTTMYELASEAAKIQASILRNEKAETEEGDARIEELESDNAALLDVGDDFIDAAKEVTGLKKEQRQIQLDPNTTPAQKREELDALQQEINDIAKDVYDLRPGGKLNSDQAAELLTAPPSARVTLLKQFELPATAALLESLA